MAKRELIIVDKNDKEIGRGEKMEIHRQGRPHRAFSVLVFNSRGELLIQKRARIKYHSSGLWSNTCCSHPRPDKNIKSEAEERLNQEMGINCPLKEVFKFSYKVNLGNLIENEFDHVFFGNFDGDPNPDKKEAEDWKWIDLEDLKKDINENPDDYTYWFKLILERLNHSLSRHPPTGGARL
jgi:isopentenyl-diphosphate delta-isomerase